MKAHFDAPVATNQTFERLALGAVARDLSEASRACHVFRSNGRVVDASVVENAVKTYARALSRERYVPDERNVQAGRLTQAYDNGRRSIARLRDGVTGMAKRITDKFNATKLGRASVHYSKRARERLESLSFIEHQRALLLENKSLVQALVQVDVVGPELTSSRVFLVTDPAATHALHWGTAASIAAGFPYGLLIYVPLAATGIGAFQTLALISTLPVISSLVSPRTLSAAVGAAAAGVGATAVRATRGNTPLAQALSDTSAKLGAFTMLALIPLVNVTIQAALAASAFRRPDYELVREVSASPAIKLEANDA